ncbi:MAG TPA: cytidine deaminase [Nocardioides sp.]|nr:cytidine deaminase [Nocardioides sp.]
MPTPPALTDPEDTKLVTLARSTRARTGAAEGAAVRDLDGRTYAAATVALPSLRLTALQVAVAMAVTSGARGLEAAVVLTDAGELSPDDVSAARDLAGTGVPVHLSAADGTLVTSTTT